MVSHKTFPSAQTQCVPSANTTRGELTERNEAPVELIYDPDAICATPNFNFDFNFWNSLSAHCFGESKNCPFCEIYSICELSNFVFGKPLSMRCFGENEKCSVGEVGTSRELSREESVRRKLQSIWVDEIYSHEDMRYFSRKYEWSSRDVSCYSWYDLMKLILMKIYSWDFPPSESQCVRCYHNKIRISRIK